jgi:hypothetical protein
MAARLPMPDPPQELSLPTNPMSKFEVFIGTWNTTGEVLETHANPAGALVATDCYRWLHGERFIVHDVDARFDGKPTRTMEVMGFDPKTKAFFATSYDDQGVSERFTVALNGRRWTIDGQSVRFKGSFDSAKNRLTGLWELKAGRGRWQPWIDLLLVRA